jgi:hypothetical protein
VTVRRTVPKAAGLKCERDVGRSSGRGRQEKERWLIFDGRRKKSRTERFGIMGSSRCYAMCFVIIVDGTS